MTDEQIIMTAMHVNDSTRDAIRWAMKQVRMQANTHQLPSVSEQNTHQPDAVVRQLVEALRQLCSIVEIHQDATGNNFAWAELPDAFEALAKWEGK